MQPPAGKAPIEALRRRGLSGWVGQCLHRYGDPRAAEFKRDVMRISLRNVVCMAALQQLVAQLRAGGVTAMPIKGSAFLLCEGSQAYGVRPMSDLDVYVHPRDYARAIELLKHEGFEARHPATDRCSAAVLNECSLAKESAGMHVMVDLHRRFGAWPTLPGLVPLMASERRRVEGIDVPTPLLFALIGLAHRVRAKELSDARELLDIYRAWSEMDRDEAERYMVKVQQLGLWQAHRRLVEEMRVTFDLETLPMVGRTGEEGVALVPAYGSFRQNLTARFGQGSAFEQVAAATLYTSARVFDRLLFRRGKERWQTRPSATGPSGYWHYAP